MRILLVGLTASVLAACATSQDSPEARQIAGQPVAYQEGYRGGCDSGYVAAGHPYYRFNKDVQRFSSDPLYAQGWSDGFNICKGKYESIGRALGR